MKTEIASVLSAVEAEEARLRAALRRVQNERVPAVALPCEVLAAIFDKACERPAIVTLVYRPYRGDIPDSRKCRNAINATCYRWRQMALATSSLWSDILLATYPFAIPNRVLIPIELERSNGRTLTTRTIIHDFENGYEFFYRTLSTLIPLSSALDLRITSWTTPFRSLEGCVPLPNLRHLRLRLYRSSKITDDPEWVDLSQANSLCLVYIDFKLVRARLNLLHLRPPETPTISDLSLTGDFDPFDVIHFIARCAPHLHTLRWQYIGAVPDLPHEVLDAIPSDGVYFPQLLSIFTWMGTSLSR